MPARTEPVTLTIAGMSWATIARPVSRSPQITLNTPGGRNSAAISASSVVRRRRGVARLEHHRVAGGDRRGELPHRHHHRVVPRRDLGAHADRLAADDRGHAAHVLAGALALEVPGGGGEEADLVDHRRDLLAAGQVRSACRCSRTSERDQLLGAGLDRVGDAEQRQRALARRGVAPVVERRRRRLHRRVDVGRRPTAGPSRTARPSTGLTTSVVRPSAASTDLPLTKFWNAFMRPIVSTGRSAASRHAPRALTHVAPCLAIAHRRRARGRSRPPSTGWR